MRPARLHPALPGIFIAVLIALPLAFAQEEEAKPKGSPGAAKEDAAKGDAAKEEPKEEAQEEPKGRGAFTEGWAPYLDFLGSTYIPGAEPSVQIKFDLSPDIPKGTKIELEFEYVGLKFDTIEYTLKDENRKGLTATWKPKRRIALGEYLLYTRIHPELQTPAVQKIIKGKQERFPPKNAPWQMYYFDKPIKVGTPEEEAKEKVLICEAYTGMVEKLINNWSEFQEKMEQVKEGKELAQGSSLDLAKFKAYVIEWRKKQGETQEEIIEFQVSEPGLFQKSTGAHLNLMELGRMVSKRAVQLQKEVTEKYKVTEINPPAHEHFDRAFKYKVDAKALNDRVDKIEALACPDKKKEEAEEEDPAAGKPGEKEGSKSATDKDSDKKDAEEKPAEEGKEGETEPEPEKPKEKEKEKPKTKKKGKPKT